MFRNITTIRENTDRILEILKSHPRPGQSGRSRRRLVTNADVRQADVRQKGTSVSLPASLLHPRPISPPSPRRTGRPAFRKTAATVSRTDSIPRLTVLQQVVGSVPGSGPKEARTTCRASPAATCPASSRHIPPRFLACTSRRPAPPRGRPARDHARRSGHAGDECVPRCILPVHSNRVTARSFLRSVRSTAALSARW